MKKIPSFAAWLIIALSATAQAGPTLPVFDTKLMTTTSTAPQSQRLTTLDIIGIGMVTEMFRQDQIWEKMQQVGDQSILPTDPDSYQKDSSYRSIIMDKRSAEVMERGASHFLTKWPIPAVSIWSHCFKEEKPDEFHPGKTNYAFYYERINDLRAPAGMHHHKIASLGAFFKDNPEEIMERAFLFFEQNPQAPALLLFVSDGDETRALTGDKSRAKHWEQGPRLFDAMTESMVTLLLTRRERVDAMRNPASFQASKYLPQAWTAEQLAVYDRLPTIATVHRPQRVSYWKDKDGKPTFDSKQKVKTMSASEQQAAVLAALKTSLTYGKPARIFYDAGSAATGKHIVPFSMALQQSLPDFDLFDAKLSFNIHRRLGETGAASPFLQWVIAATASYRQKGVSFTVNLRQADEATITVITPSDDKRKHPMGDPISFQLAPEDGSPAQPNTVAVNEDSNAFAQSPAFDPDATLPPGFKRPSAQGFDFATWDPDSTLPPGVKRPI